jgi:hypothetical protein
MEKKKKIKFFSLKDQPTDFAFWQTKSPQERIQALEHLRNQYLTDANGERKRLHRGVLSLAKRPKG